MAKKYDFTNFSFDTIEDKAIPRLEHEFRPIEDDPDIVVKCNYFKAGEKGTFIDVSAKEERATFNFRRIVEKQVISISGLVLTVTDAKTGKPLDFAVKDPETLLSLPDVGIVNQMVQSIANHLISNDTLSEKQEGN